MALFDVVFPLGLGLMEEARSGIFRVSLQRETHMLWVLTRMAKGYTDLARACGMTKCNAMERSLLMVQGEAEFFMRIKGPTHHMHPNSRSNHFLKKKKSK